MNSITYNGTTYRLFNDGALPALADTLLLRLGMLGRCSFTSWGRTRRNTSSASAPRRRSPCKSIRPSGCPRHIQTWSLGNRRTESLT